MNKGKIARLVGFVAAVGISAALVAAAVSSTGAYFTASQAGSMTGSAGTISINADPTTTTTLNFQKLMPGQNQNEIIRYTVGGDSNVDTWLVFQPDTAYCQFSGGKGDPTCPVDSRTNKPEGGLGGYGHFAVTATNVQRFSSYNLANEDYIAGQPPVSTCANNPEGWGTANPPANVTDQRCGVPLAIKLEVNLKAGQARNVNLEFGLTSRWTAKGAQALGDVHFKIVATQVGISPTANGAFLSL